MRKFVANFIYEKLNLLELHHEWLSTSYNPEEWETILNRLIECQEIVIEIDSVLEREIGVFDKLVTVMEQYCELIYQLTLCQENTKNWQANRELLEKNYFIIRSMIKTISVKKEIVFFPYKASMWDCMDSVWEAAKRDETCNVVVVPIPYFEKNSTGEFVTAQYEIDLFPEHVEVLDFSKYSLDERQPDIAYIHNPFDQFNNVTSVHPDYYTSVLKEKVKTVVYIPYYLALTEVAYSQRELPAYYHVDYIIVASQECMDSFSRHISRDKFLVLGSPIVDRLLRLQNAEKRLPPEWGINQISDEKRKRFIFFNTSLSGLLKDKEYFLGKIKNMLSLFEKEKDIFVIWRPHPLMHATLQRMGPKYEIRYQELENEFLSKRIGVLDKSADVSAVVSICDAYVGEETSSIVNMFEIEGKPRFLISTNRYEIIEKKSEIWLETNQNSKDLECFYVKKYQLLCTRSRETGEIKILAEIKEFEALNKIETFDMYTEKDKIYLFVSLNNGFYVFDMKSNILKKIYFSNGSKEKVIEMKKKEDRLFFILENETAMLQFDMISESFHKLNVEEKKELEQTGRVTAVFFDLKDFKEKIKHFRADKVKRGSFGTGTIKESEMYSLFDFLCYINIPGFHNKSLLQKQALERLGNKTEISGAAIHRVMMLKI